MLRFACFTRRISASEPDLETQDICLDSAPKVHPELKFQDPYVVT